MSEVQNAAQILTNRKNLIQKHLGPLYKKPSPEEWEMMKKAKDLAAMEEADAAFAAKRMREIEKITRGQTFQNFICRHQWQRSLKTMAESYARNPDGWFYIGGQSGCGKTHLCLAICKELARQRQFVTLCRWREDIWLLSDRSFDKSEERMRKLKTLKTAGTLFVDDFLKGHAGTSEKQIAFEIIDARYLAGKRTIISSEYSLKQVIETFDEAIGGRLKEMCGKNIITIPEDRNRNYRVLVETIA